MTPTLLQDGAKTEENPKRAPRRPQDGPKTTPRWAKMAPRRPQDGPKRAPRWPQEGPEIALRWKTKARDPNMNENLHFPSVFTHFYHKTYRAKPAWQ